MNFKKKISCILNDITMLDDEKYDILENIFEQLNTHENDSLMDKDFVEFLLENIINYANKDIRELFLYEILQIDTENSIYQKINWNNLIKIIDDVNIQSLAYILEILGYSGNMKYLKIIEKYENFNNNYVILQVKESYILLISQFIFETKSNIEINSSLINKTLLFLPETAFNKKFKEKLLNRMLELIENKNVSINNLDNSFINLLELINLEKEKIMNNT